MRSCNFFGKFKYSLANTFAGAVFLFSLVLGVIITILSVFLMYFHDQRDLGYMLDHIHLTVEKTLVTGLWLTNDDIVTAVLDGLVAIPEIEQVTINRDDGKPLERGQITSTRIIQHSHPLLYKYSEQSIPLGSITLTAGDDVPMSSILSDSLSMAAPIFSLAILGALFSFVLFYFLIGRHLQDIANYSAAINLDSLNKPLTLQRTPHDKKTDELDLISSALNSMRTSLRTSLALIRENDAKFKAIVNNSSDAIVTINKENRIIYANPATCQHLDLPLDDVIGKSYLELGFSEDMCTLLEQSVKSVLKNGVTKEIFIDRHSRTKEVQILEMQLTPNESSNDEIVSVVGIARDITLRRKSESMLRVAFQHLPMMMTISDIETARYVEVNDRFTELTGYSRQQSIARSSIDLGIITREDRHKLKRAILEEGFVKNVELQLTRADGSTMDCVCYGNVIEVDGAKALLLISQDITEQKKALKERADMERQLQHAMKMESIGTLAGGIAHDFNNILSAILGYSQLALEYTTHESPVYHDLKQVIQAGTRASDLVKQILAFSRQGHEEFRPVRLQSLIKEVVKLLRSTMPTTISLRLDIDEACGTVLADAVQLHQVLMNLCTNARQAIGNENGEISIALHVSPIPSTLSVIERNLLKAENYLELKVSDNGIGMSPEILSRIFDPFFTTREKDQGTGLGLAVTHGIISKHQGAITVASRPGAGTTFHIYLPIIEVLTEADTATIEENLYGQEHLLVVDDEHMLVDILERSLHKLGYTVSSFGNSQDALNYFISYPDEIDLLVTDMTMPGMTGLAIFREMRKIRPELRVILCTGYSDAIDEKTATAEGINAFLRKPVTGKDIARVLRSM